MGSFFGGIFKFFGMLLMIAAGFALLVTVLMNLDPAESHRDIGFHIFMFILVVGLPFLVGRTFYRFGKWIAGDEKPAEVKRGRASRDELETVDVQQPSPQNTPRFTPRRVVQEVEVEVEPEPTPFPVLANAVPSTPQKRPKHDPTAMGVDELFDPDAGN
jgi:hypothetical protein